MADKLLIVGSFRGGLGYVRELLTRAGYVVGDTFDRKTNPGNVVELAARALPIEVSPYVVPYLGQQVLADRKIVYILRDPRLVIGSLLRVGYPHKLVGPRPTWYEIACQALNDYADKFGAEGCEADAALSLVHNWMKLAGTFRPDLVSVQLEAGPLAVLQTIVDWPREKYVPYCPTDINGGGHVVNLTGAGRQPETFQADLQTLLGLHGYYAMRLMPKGGHAHYTNPSWHC